ncbi:hypothetical protein Tco_0849292 [Tanacetum coccineum]
MVDNLPKIVWYSMHHSIYTEAWLLQSKRLAGKELSNPFIADDLLKIIWLSMYHGLTNLKIVWYSMHHCIHTEAWLLQSKRLAGKELSNPFIADDLLKIIWLSMYHEVQDNPLKPKVKLKVQALEDESWVEAMQEELSSSQAETREASFISQDSSVLRYSRNLNLVKVQSCHTPMNKLPLTKDEEALCMMYTCNSKDFSSQCCQENLQVSQGQTKLGLWYPRESPLDLESFSDRLWWYALSANPTIYDSLVKQFWQSAIASIKEDGFLEIKNVTPPTTKGTCLGKEQSEDKSPNTLEAAKTLSKVASLKSRSIDKGRRYKRRKETKSKKVVSSLDFQEDDAGAEKINTAGEINAADSTAGENKGQREGKAPMLSEETPKKSKEQILQEEASLAEAIRLSKAMLGSELQGEDFAKRMVDIINQRKKLFAEERAKAKRNKPMTQSQLKTYMMNYLKNQGTWKITQLKKLSFEEVKEEFDKLVKQIESFTPISFEATKASLKRFGEELQTKTPKRLKEEKGDEAKDDESTKKSGKRRKQMARKGMNTNVDENDSEDSDKVDEQEETNTVSISRDDLPELKTDSNEKIWVAGGPEENLEKEFWKKKREDWYKDSNPSAACLAIRKVLLEAMEYIHFLHDQRLAEVLDAEVKRWKKRWSSEKQSNLRALLSSLQYVCVMKCSSNILLKIKIFHVQILGGLIVVDGQLKKQYEKKSIFANMALSVSAAFLNDADALKRKADELE